MTPRLRTIALFSGFAFAGLLFCGQSVAGSKSDSKVKATVNATKPDADGKQRVTVTLAIEAGFIVYANPVGEELLDSSRLRIRFKAEDIVAADVRYPAGRPIKLPEEKITYHVYENQAKVLATVQRKVGDTSPLQVEIFLHAMPTSMMY